MGRRLRRETSVHIWKVRCLWRQCAKLDYVFSKGVLIPSKPRCCQRVHFASKPQKDDGEVNGGLTDSPCRLRGEWPAPRTLLVTFGQLRASKSQRPASSLTHLLQSAYGTGLPHGRSVNAVHPPVHTDVRPSQENIGAYLIRCTSCRGDRVCMYGEYTRNHPCQTLNTPIGRVSSCP